MHHTTTRLTGIFALLCLTPGLAFAEFASYGEYLQYTETVLSVTVLGVILAFGTVALVWNYRYQYEGPDHFLKYAWKVPLARLSLGVVLVVVVVNLFTQRTFDSKEDVLVLAQQRRLPEMAYNVYLDMLDQGDDDPELHHQFVTSFYLDDDWKLDQEFMKERDMATPWGIYHDAFRAPETPSPSYHLGQAMMLYYEADFREAKEVLEELPATGMPYRNLYLARVHMKQGRWESAEAAYRREFAEGDDKRRTLAAEGIFYAAFARHRMDVEALESLLLEEELRPYLPPVVYRYVYTLKGDLVPYLEATVSSWTQNINWVGFTGAALGLLVWISFFRQLDIFRKRNWWQVIGMVLLGCVFTFVAFPAYDLLEFRFDFSFNGEGGTDFLFSVFGVGLVEETVKILPFLMIFFFTKWVRGPVDIMVYSALAALGFAFVENLQYFEPHRIDIMHGRITMAVTGHLFDTGTFAFGMVLGLYRFPRWKALIIPGFFFLAILAHGLYDFFIISPAVRGLQFLTFVLFIYGTFQYAAYLNNSLNNSRFFRGRFQFDSGKLAFRLFAGLVLVYLYEYVAISLFYGASTGNYQLASSIAMGGYLIFFVVLNLTNIDVVQGEWIFMRLWNFGTRADFNRVLGQQVCLREVLDTRYLQQDMLPVCGEVIARMRLGETNRIYLMALDRPLTLGSRELDYLLVHARNIHEPLVPGEENEVVVYAFRDKEALLRDRKRKSDFVRLGNSTLC